MNDVASIVFGAGVTSVQRDIPPDTLEIPSEVHRGPKGAVLTFEIRRLPTLEAQDIISRINNVVQAPGDAYDKLMGLMEACKLLTDERGKKGKKKPPVIAGLSGLTLPVFEAAVNDHREYRGEVFERMRADDTMEFAPESSIIRYLLAQNALIRMMVLGKMAERVAEVQEEEAGKDDASASSSG